MKIHVIVKLTLSLDKEVIEKAKAYVKKKGVSLSAFIEEYLREKVNERSFPNKIQAFNNLLQHIESMNIKEGIGNLKEEKMHRLEQKYLDHDND